FLDAPIRRVDGRGFVHRGIADARGDVADGVEVPREEVVEQVLTAAARDVVEVLADRVRYPDIVRIVRGARSATPRILLHVGESGTVVDLRRRDAEVES